MSPKWKLSALFALIMSGSNESANVVRPVDLFFITLH